MLVIIVLSVFMINLATVSVCKLNATILGHCTECSYDNCYIECLHAECYCSQSCSAKCHFRNCLYAEHFPGNCYAECHYAEFHCVECGGARDGAWYV
jgi:hypothetical protein